MLTGIRAFEGGNYTVLTAAIALREPESVCKFRNDVPAELERTVSRALAKGRDARYPNALAFRQALLDCWARIRAEGITRGHQYAKGRLEAKRPDDTDINIEIPIFVDSAANFPERKRKPPG
jgi:hypothetical protein